MSNINVNNITPLAGTSGTVSVSGSLLVSGSITANGNIVLGDSTADSVSLGAEVSSSIIPDANNSYNLGSTAKTWKTIFVSTASIGLVSSSLIPDADNTYDLGSSTKEYKDLYVDGVANIDTLGAATDGVGVAYINILSSSNSEMAGGGISCSVALIPSTDNKYDLGSSTLEWKDLYVDGVAYIDSFDAINSTGNSVLGNAASDTHTITGNITSSGNISGSTSVNTITVTATSLGGTLTTAAQTNITSVGTLSSLAVGNVTSTGNITAISMSAVWLSASSGIYGTLQTAAQNNITSLGVLTIVSSSGNSVLGDALSDTHTITGNITASNNINAAGTISASNFVASGGTSTFLGITATGNSALGNANTDTHAIKGTITHTLGDITTTGNITASGTISASGDLIGDELRLKTKKIYEFGGNGTSDVQRLTIGSANEFSGSLKISASSQNPGFLDVVGDITSSGNITASGTIQANIHRAVSTFNLGATGLPVISQSSGKFVFGQAQTVSYPVGVTRVTGSNIEMGAPVTASVISASAAGTNLIGTASHAESSSHALLLAFMTTLRRLLKRAFFGPLLDDDDNDDVPLASFVELFLIRCFIS